MDSMLLKLNDTTLLFLKPPEMQPQVVQITLKTPGTRATVNELAEFHLSQSNISQALLRVVQADMILCGGEEDEGEGGFKEGGVKGLHGVQGARGGAASDDGAPKAKGLVGLPEEFMIRSEGFSIRCHKERWVYPLTRWTFLVGEKEVRPALHKWRFQLEVVQG